MNIKLLPALLALACFAAPAAWSDESDAAPDAAPDAEAAAEKPRYELKNKSSFNVAPGARQPFWPIGWVKRAANAPVEVASGPRFILEEKNFHVTSILAGPPAIAVVNGRAYEEGQFLRIPRTAQQAASGASGPRIRVHRIIDGQVWLSHENQIIPVSLRRPELNDKKIETELLNEQKDDFYVAPPAAVAPTAAATR